MTKDTQALLDEANEHLRRVLMDYAPECAGCGCSAEKARKFLSLYGRTNTFVVQGLSATGSLVGDPYEVKSLHDAFDFIIHYKNTPGAPHWRVTKTSPSGETRVYMFDVLGMHRFTGEEQ